MNYDKIAKQIQDLVGKDNIISFTHCATRLRLTLKDESCVDDEKVKNIDGVLGIAKNGVQYQIIIGNQVPKVYAALEAIAGQGSATTDTPKEKKKSIEVIFDFVSSVFTPVLPAIIGAGLIKSVLALAVLLGASTESTTYYFINLIGDAPLYFLPIMLAFTAAKKLGCNQFLAVSIAGAMIHPQYTALIKDAYSLHYSSFLGMPVTLATYSSSVIPVLLMAIALKYFDQLFEKIIPDALKFFFKPLLTLLVVAPVTFIVLGPIGFMVGVGISTGLNVLNTYAGWLVPTIIGLIFPLMVTAGMHYGLVPFMMQSIAAQGYETIAGPGNLTSNIAQGAASLAVAIKTKNKNLKQTAFTTGTTALLGVTEPALFGVTLKYKKVLACVMAGGGIGGFYAGITGVKCFSFCSPGLLSLVAFIGPNGWGNLINACISLSISFVATFVLVYLFGYSEPGQETIKSPVEGTIIPLKDVNDPTFAQEMLGKGFAVIPENNIVKAPVSGEIVTLFPTKHAVGIKGNDGVEVLIHIGIDTVKLNGQYFETSLKMGDKVKQGDPLVTVDFDSVKKEGYDTATIVVITNTNDYKDVRLVKEGTVSLKEPVLDIVQED